MFSLEALASRLGGEVVGDGAVTVSRVATLQNAGSGDIAFLANPKYRSQLNTCQATALILNPESRDLSSTPRIVTRDPYLYFARVAQLLNPSPAVVGGIAATATVESPVPASVFVGPGATVGRDVVIGEGAYIGANCVIGDRVKIGPRTRLHAQVTIYSDCEIGADGILHAGVVIGADGFGFARERDGSWVKIPQIGRVIIGNDVEIGANTTVDRGALDDTVIEDGVKLDNLIQIAHNVQVGANSIMAGMSGVAGSTRIGKRCMVGGQSGISGHLTITDDVIVSADTLVSKSIPKPGVYTANLPLQPHADWVKNFSYLRHLEALADRIRVLEQQTEKKEASS